MPTADAILAKHLGADSFTAADFRDNHRLTVPADAIFRTLECLKNHGGFDFLCDITAVDYLQYPNAKDRFGVVYLLTNLSTGERVIVKTYVNDPDPKLPSAYHLWRGADWMEREVFDLYGIVFEGHPDLRRILMPDGFAGHPLRKDYPLRGYGERHNFVPITRAEA